MSRMNAKLSALAIFGLLVSFNNICRHAFRLEVDFSSNVHRIARDAENGSLPTAMEMVTGTTMLGMSNVSDNSSLLEEHSGRTDYRHDRNASQRGPNVHRFIDAASRLNWVNQVVRQAAPVVSHALGYNVPAELLLSDVPIPKDDVSVLNGTLSLNGFSDTGKKVLTKLNKEFPELRGTRWAETFADFEPNFKWFWQSPISQLGRTTASLKIAQRCTKAEPDCNAEFELYKCRSQQDCKDKGVCTPMQATGDSHSLCIGHSDKLYDYMYQVMTKAEVFLDLASLSAPTGRFLAAYRKAIQYLFSKTKPVKVRFLIGENGELAKAQKLLRDLTTTENGTEVPRKNAAHQIVVGKFRQGTWWNHAKIIAVDGKYLFQGGHNLWDEDYLTAAPVHDLSMYVEGDAARFAHAFLNDVWHRSVTVQPLRCAVCDSEIVSVPRNKGLAPQDYYRATVRQPRKQSSGSSEFRASVISVGRFRTDSSFQRDAAEIALTELFREAKQSIKMSLQDLGSLAPGAQFNAQFLEALCEALANGVHLWMVLSMPRAGPKLEAAGINTGSGVYGNGFTFDSLRQLFTDTLKNQYSRTEHWANLRVNHQVHLAHLRYLKSEDQWAHPGERHSPKFANHAKFYMVDDSIFYLGSYNLYPTNLAEYGLIVDDKEISKQVTQLQEFISEATTERESRARRGVRATPNST